MSTNSLIIDETTYYSILGINSCASETQIKRSFMKLARELHPDKSKSNKAEELFKLVAHAHSILIDPEKRSNYDKALIAKGLHTYTVKKHEPPPPSVNKIIDSKLKATKKSNAYENQPYGFGDLNENKTFNRVSRNFGFKAFKPKYYQNNRESLNLEKGHKRSSTYSSSFVSSDETNILSNKSDSDETIKTKIAKKDERTSNITSSLFKNSIYRRYARSLHRMRLQQRRTLSPATVMQSSKTDSLNAFKKSMSLFRDKQWDYSNINPVNEQNNQKKTYSHSDQLFEETSIKVTRSNNELNLEELNNTLPNDVKVFDMQKVSYMLDDVRVKRPKLKNEYFPEVEMTDYTRDNDSVSMYPQPIENLQKPVNKPLPRFYKPDVIPFDHFNMDLTVSQIFLPIMPTLLCNVLDKDQVKQCSEQVKQFNIQANQVKRKLVSLLSRRIEADNLLDERMIKVENLSNYVQSKSYDMEIVSKLSELQNRQIIVAESFANLMKTLYASGIAH